MDDHFKMHTMALGVQLKEMYSWEVPLPWWKRIPYWLTFRKPPVKVVTLAEQMEAAQKHMLEHLNRPVFSQSPNVEKKTE